jgi:hypothetical protein
MWTKFVRALCVTAVWAASMASGAANATAPTLDPIPAATSSNPLPVTGTAPADSEVRFYVNGTLLQVATATGSGVFSAKIPLYDGSNSVQATAFNGVSESEASAAQSIAYTSTQPRQQSGTISSDIVWTPAGGAYVLTANLTVAAGAELTVMPGVEVRAGNFYLYVNGSLVTLGTPASPVAFRANTPTATAWRGISIPSTGYVDLQNSVIEKATVGLQFNGGEGVVRSTVIQANTTGVEVLAGSSPAFSDGYRIINNTAGVAVRGNNVEADNPNPSFVNGSIYGSYQANYSVASFRNGQNLVLTATGNWWGNADPSEIAKKITDQSDNATLPLVNFAGYLNAQDGTAAHSGGFIGGRLLQDRTLPAGTYQVLGTIVIPQGMTLTLEPGATLRFPSHNPTFSLQVYGTLAAHGTSASPIVFQSSQSTPAAGNWAGIQVYATGIVDIEQAVIEHAANGFYFAGGEGSVKSTIVRTNTNGVYVEAESSPVFSQGFQIVGNSTGVYVKGHASDPAKNPQPVFTGGAILSSALLNYKTEAFVAGDNVILDATNNWWGLTTASAIAIKVGDNSDNANSPTVNFSGYTGALGAAPVHPGAFLFGPVKANRILATADYQVLGNVRISAGATLAVASGTTLRMPSATAIDVNGTLLVQGAAAAPVQWRAESSSGGKGSWTGIRVWSTGSVDFDYAVVEQAGRGALYFEGGTGTFRHTTVQNNFTGVSIQGGSSPQFLDGCVVRSNSDGIIVTADGAGNPSPVFKNGAIYGNTTYALKTESYVNAGNMILDATGNWWGTTDTFSIANKIADNSDNANWPVVNYSGYLNSENGSVAHTGAFLFGPIAGTQSLPAGDYQLLGTLHILAGASLTLSPGTTIRVPGTSSFAIDVNGTLVAHGTPEAPILFSPSLAAPARNSWAGIRVWAGGYLDLDHATVEYAGSGALYFEGGDGIVRHTTLRYSHVGAVIKAASTPEFSEGFVVTGNNEGIILTGTSAGDPRPSFTRGAVYGNDGGSTLKTESYAAGSAITIDATHNWWGSNDPVVIKAHIADRLDNAKLPSIDYLDFKASLGGPSRLVAYDFVFPRRDADAVAGTTTRTEMTLNTAADVINEVVFEDTNTVVRAVTESSPRGAYAFEWDGRDDAGNGVAEGTYRIRTRLSADGRTFEFDPPSTNYELSGDGTIPARFNAYRNEMWKMQYHRTEFSTMKMRVTPPNGPAFYPILNHIAPADSTDWIYWDGRDPQGNLVTGALDIYFDAPRPPRSQYLRLLRSGARITGLQPAPAIEVKADPYLITHSYEQVSRFAFRIDLDAYVTVRLLPPGVNDPQSPQAITVLPEQLLSAQTAQGTPQDHVVEWRGNQAGDPNLLKTSDEGAYTFAIQARSPVTNRTSLYRGVLQIYQ